LTYTADNFQPAKFQTIWRLFGDGSNDIPQPVGFDRFNYSKSIFITTENHREGDTFMLSLLRLSLAQSPPPSFFHSRIATGP